MRTQTKKDQCEDCNKPISVGAAWYSLRMYGKKLCYTDQIAQNKSKLQSKPLL